MHQDFEVDQIVTFKKLKGSRIVQGRVSSFIMDKKKNIPYAVVKDVDGKKYTVQLKKLSTVEL